MKKLMWPLLLLGTLALGVVIYKFKGSSSPTTPVSEAPKEEETETPHSAPSDSVGSSGGPLDGVSASPSPAPSYQPYRPGGQVIPEQQPPQIPPSVPPGFGAYPPPPSPQPEDYSKGDPYIPPPPPSQGYEPPTGFPDYPDHPDMPPPSFGDSIPMDEEGFPGGVPGVTGAPPIDDDY